MWAALQAAELGAAAQEAVVVVAAAGQAVERGAGSAAAGLVVEWAVEQALQPGAA